MYESPIMVNVTDPIFESINKVQDEYVIRACQTISADINQEELVKALQEDDECDCKEIFENTADCPCDNCEKMNE